MGAFAQSLFINTIIIGTSTMINLGISGVINQDTPQLNGTKKAYLVAIPVLMSILVIISSIIAVSSMVTYPHLVSVNAVKDFFFVSSMFSILLTVTNFVISFAAMKHQVHQI